MRWEEKVCLGFLGSCIIVFGLLLLIVIFSKTQPAAAEEEEEEEVFSLGESKKSHNGSLLICPVGLTKIWRNLLICTTVSEAAYVLDSIVGFDPRDFEATKVAAKFIPQGGYTQFLNKDGLDGKKLGVVKNPLLGLSNISSRSSIFETHLEMLRERSATIVDLKELITSPVRSLSGITNFNQNHTDLERNEELGCQDILIAAVDSTNGIGEEEKHSIETMKKLSRDGFEKLMLEKELDAIVILSSDFSSYVLAIGGFPGITVPAGYDSDGMPLGICFSGLKGTESTLIEIACAFEQAAIT